MVNMEKIRELSREKGFTIAELERRAGVGNAVIARWEKQRPRIDTLKSVADVLGVTVDELLQEPTTKEE